MKIFSKPVSQGWKLACWILAFYALIFSKAPYAEKFMIQEFPNIGDPGETIPLNPQHQPQKEALRQTLVKYLRGQFRIREERYYLLILPAGWNSLEWIAVEKFFTNTLRDRGYQVQRVQFPWHETGIDIVGVFQLGDGPYEYVAVSILKDLIGGKRLIGYFSLERVTKPGESSDEIAIVPVGLGWPGFDAYYKKLHQK